MQDVQRSEQPDLYEQLGVAPTSSREEITAAFRRLVRKLHPDAHAHPGAEVDSATLVGVIEAYKVLAQPDRRREYDRSRGYGARIRVKVPAARRVDVSPCRMCASTGAIIVRCPRCGGHGYLLRSSPWLQQPVRCPLCLGAAALAFRCEICNGTGFGPPGQ